jgi:3D-(3,5/4)-trihydroxycyclohexane-1,2-dione acylhydrolase (decyclizing)
MFCTASRRAGHDQHADRRRNGPHQPPADADAVRRRLPTRLPDPVLQQVEHFGNPALGVTDAFKSVSVTGTASPTRPRFCNRCQTRIATMLDPADCGPAFLGLPQDVQGWAYDYPVEFFAERVHRIRRQSARHTMIADAAALLKAAEARS